MQTKQLVTSVCDNCENAQILYTPNKNEPGLSSCGNLHSASYNEEGVDSWQGTLESTDGYCTAVSGFGARSKQSPSLRISDHLFAN